jgi:transmembrane sensor
MKRMKTVSNEEVARWVVRLDAGALSPDEERELNAWLDAAPHHRGALIRARAAWADLDRIGALAGGSSSGTSPYTFVSTRRYLLAASLAAITLGGAGYFAYALTRDVYDTGIGEVRRVTLADGSSMVLNSGTKAVVRFDDTQREVQLERGEALFEVRKDKARPFIVRTDGLSVRAVGTAFAVRIADERVAVTVTEGVVEVARAVDAPQRVAANHRAVVKSAAPVAIEPIAPAIANRQLAWRDGMVAFDGELLGEAVAEINRHSRRPIVIDDPALGAMQIVGIFRVGDVEGFANAAATALGAEVQTDGDVIHLTRMGESR